MSHHIPVGIACPACGYEGSTVVDSRGSLKSTTVRRRRACLGCAVRFTTYESVRRPAAVEGALETARVLLLRLQSAAGEIERGLAQINRKSTA